MTATQRLGSGRTAEFSDTGGSGGLSRDISYIAKIDGPVGLGGLAAIAGTLITVVLPVTGKVSCFASFTAYSNGGSNLPASTHLYIRIDGIDYEVSGNTLDIGVFGPSYADSVSGVYAITLSAGSHTFQIAAAGNTNMFANPANPAVLVVEYPILTVPVTTASPITSQEAKNDTGTPTTNATTTYAVIPNTLINFTLPGTQTIMLEGYATSHRISTSSDMNVQFGVRIDGIDYNGTSVIEQQYLSEADGAFTVVVSKAISLASGAHTAQLILKQANAVFAAAAVENSVARPTVLTALYTTPQVAGDGVVEGARVTKSTSTVLAASTPTVLTWDTVLNNSNGVYSGGSPTRLTAITGGWYTVFGSITWNTYAFTTTEWSLKARKNGSTIVGKDLFHTTSAGAYSIFPEQNKVNELVYLNAGDYIELIAETTEPSNRNTIISASEYSPIFSMVLAQIGSGSGGGSGLGFSEVIETGGQFDTASATFVDVTGTTLNFATTAMGNVTVKAQFTGIRDAADTDISAHYALKIDGTDYNMGGLKLSLAGGFNGFWVQSFEKTIALAAGAHTAVLRLRSNGANNSHIASDTDKPTIVTAHYAI